MMSSKKRYALALRRYTMGSSPSTLYAQTFGCSRRFLRAFLEHQFQPGMEWENFGECWCISHLVPPALFEDDPEDGEICWNWANLIPLSPHKARLGVPSGAAVSRLAALLHAFPDNDMIPKLMEQLPRAEDGVPNPDWSKFHFSEEEKDVSS